MNIPFSQKSGSIIYILIRRVARFEFRVGIKIILKYREIFMPLIVVFERRIVSRGLGKLFRVCSAIALIKPMLYQLIETICGVEESPTDQVDTTTVFTTKFFGALNVCYLFEKSIGRGKSES